MSDHLEKTAIVGWLPDWMPGWVMPAISVLGVADAVHSNIRARKMEKQLLEQQKLITDSAKFNQRIKDIGMALLSGAAIAEGGRMINRYVNDKPVIQVPDVTDIFNDPEKSKKTNVIKKTSDSFVKSMRKLT